MKKLILIGIIVFSIAADSFAQATYTLTPQIATDSSATPPKVRKPKEFIIGQIGAGLGLVYGLEQSIALNLRGYYGLTQDIRINPAITYFFSPTNNQTDFPVSFYQLHLSGNYKLVTEQGIPFYLIGGLLITGESKSDTRFKINETSYTLLGLDIGMGAEYKLVGTDFTFFGELRHTIGGFVLSSSGYPDSFKGQDGSQFSLCVGARIPLN